MLIGGKRASLIYMYILCKYFKWGNQGNQIRGKFKWANNVSAWFGGRRRMNGGGGG